MKSIATVDELHEVVAESHQHPILIYKHSTACSIAARAAVRLDEYLHAEDADDLPPCYQVNVIESRPVSNAVEKDLDIAHASPQLILVQNGAAVWNTSHSSIRAENIDKALAEHLTVD